MKPSYCIPERSPNRQRQGKSKQREVLRIAILHLEINFKQTT